MCEHMRSSVDVEAAYKHKEKRVDGVEDVESATTKKNPSETAKGIAG